LIKAANWQPTQKRKRKEDIEINCKACNDSTNDRQKISGITKTKCLKKA